MVILVKLNQTLHHQTMGVLLIRVGDSIRDKTSTVPKASFYMTRVLKQALAWHHLHISYTSYDPD